DRWDQASWFELGGEVRGVAENVDYYVFEVPGGGDAPAGSELVEAWDLNLAAEANVQLALFDADQRPLLERNGSQGTVRALQLQPGAYYVRVRGSGDVPYVLSFSPSTAAEQGFEREPNDRVEIASPMGPE